MQTKKAFRAPSVSLRIVSVLGVLLATLVPAALAGPREEAEQIASLAGFHGGLVVHVGCGDGKLTAALRLADNCVVQGLETGALGILVREVGADHLHQDECPLLPGHWIVA